MVHPRPIRSATRAPRVPLHGVVAASVRLENLRQFNARLHQISVTGGLLEIANFIDERSRIVLTFPLGSGIVHARAEMFFPMRGGMGYMQPFRFVSFGAGARQTLENEIRALLKPILVPTPPQAAAKPQAPTRSGHGTGLPLPRFLLDS